jgi:hypothetical protein
VSGIPTYSSVSLGEVYNGIELKLKAYGNNVEKLFFVQPGSDPVSITVRLSGAGSIKANEAGELEAATELGVVRFTRPVAYQVIDGKRIEIPVNYMPHAPNSAFRIPHSSTVLPWERTTAHRHWSSTLSLPLPTSGEAGVTAPLPYR